MPEDHPVTTPDSGADREEKKRKRKQRQKRRFPGLSVWLVVLVCVLGASFLQLRAEAMDFAIAFMATWGLIFLAITVLFVWFVAFSAYQRHIRMSVLAAVVLLNVVFWTCFKIDHVWGELFPALKWRFSPDRDELLAQPKNATDTSVDLASTNEKLDFPGFLGPGRTNRISGDKILLTHWNVKAPREMWRKPIGAGWSGFVAVNGYAVTMEQRGENEWTSCYQIDTGKMVWAYPNKTRHRTILGDVGPRSTPMISGGRVYSQGATGILACLDGTTGNLIWSRNLLSESGSSEKQDGKVVFWGRSGSPLVVDDLVIIPLGGPPDGPFVSLAAFHRETGKVIWRSGDRQVSYSSPAVATLNGTRQALIVNEDNVSGHRLDDGKLLWSYPWPGDSTGDASVSQAVPLDAKRLLISKGYGKGLALLEVNDSDRPKLLWQNRRVMKTKFTNVVIDNGYVYGLSDGILECVSLQDGSRQWKKGRFGQGQILGVGDVMLVQAEEGEIHMIALDPSGYRELGSIEALTDKTWNNLCLYGNKLIARNSVEVVCYELPVRQAAKKTESPPKKTR